MARYLVALILALVCFMQVYSAPAEDVTPDPFQETLKSAQDQINKLFNTDNLGKTLNDNLNTFNEGLNKAFADSKPTIEQIMAKGQELISQLPSIIPKTDEAKTPST